MNFNPTETVETLSIFGILVPLGPEEVMNRNTDWLLPHPAGIAANTSLVRINGYHGKPVSHIDPLYYSGCYRLTFGNPVVPENPA